ncbi:uncharacterized protein BDZ83DRAFT_416168 [Colletotrichum acutatum]|uniref:Secreted protein n=1 Tax=Glomerella acutata TaxID=27357 RepID=A0AAD8UE76_GLOAC|nr:uncharacterized protein BDZ83DRAFT_416168 [Colletotrichum acutatum]KAK1722552.1 hypothetical protein BDZ83DRAFT_416168 [Colletotrichum acutatum]
MIKRCGAWVRIYNLSALLSSLLTSSAKLCSNSVHYRDPEPTTRLPELASSTHVSEIARPCEVRGTRRLEKEKALRPEAERAGGVTSTPDWRVDLGPSASTGIVSCTVPMPSASISKSACLRLNIVSRQCQSRQGIAPSTGQKQLTMRP